jgi:pimeloyl-ACP methyl ester carboxylesterase
MWQAQMKALSDRYRVIAWDMRGHGRSDSPADPAFYSLRASVADMRAVMHACGVERAAIGGLSLGGFLSLAFHIAHPESTTALLLCDTGPAKKRSTQERMPPTERDSPGLSNTRRGVLESADDEILASLGSIRVPTLVICGALDQRYLPATEFLASAIPGAVKVILEGAGHVSNLDHPDAFNAAVSSFLERVTRPPV